MNESKQAKKCGEVRIGISGWRYEKRKGLKIITYDAKAGAREFEKLNATIKKAHLQVPIAAEFSLEEAAKAQQRIEQGHVLGKIILRVQG